MGFMYKTARKALSVLVPPLLTLICAELFMQVIDYPNLKYEESLQRFRSNSQYHHFHAPNEYYKQIKQDRNGDLVVDRYLKFDSSGLRDWPQKKGLPKIIFIGDSFVEAFQVELGSMFGNLAEARLGNVDIVNVGCSSWSSLQYYLWLRDNLASFKKVRAVYLFYCPNDPFDTARYLSSADDPYELENVSFKKYFQWRVQRGEEAIVAPWKKWARKHIKLYLLLSFSKNKVKDIFSKKGPPAKENPFSHPEYNSWEPLFEGVTTEQQKEAVGLDNKFIVKINDLLKEKGIGFTLVFIPYPYQVSLDENRIGAKFYSAEQLKVMAESRVFQDFLSELASRNNFRFLDLVPYLKDYKKRRRDALLYNIKDGHLSTEGHHAVAEFLVSDIASAGGDEQP